MPNYEFRCLSCSKQFLKSLPFGTKESPACPVCKGMTKRLITPPMVHFKGSGFYKTDNAAKTPEKKENAPAPATPAPAPTESKAPPPPAKPA